ncbi:MAG: beta-lactamase family protein, partial [Gemmatimonadota bacterium]|nr:beta-lactamase family protein [Gemmatimonadota bacterium]
MKRYLKILGWVLLALFILTVPIGVNYVRYTVPLKTLPEARLDHVVVQATGDLDLGVEASELMRAYLESASLPGVSAAVSRGDAAWAGAAGFADVGGAVPVSLTTSFRVGSTGKPLTALVLARLFEEGRIDLDTAIGTYKPDLPEHLHGITPRQLASHTAGIRHYRLRDFNLYTLRKRTTAENGLALFKDDDLVFPPGTGFSYSTYGYTLLGEVMAAALGSDFLSLLDRELIRAAGLSNTSPDYPDRE